MSKEAKALREKRLKSNLYKPNEVDILMQAYADEVNKEWEQKLEKIYQTGLNCISYVGAANYQSRESEARSSLVRVYQETLKQIEK